MQYLVLNKNPSEPQNMQDDNYEITFVNLG